MPPTVSPDDVQVLLASQFTTPVANLVQLTVGSVARIFAFEVEGEPFVIRFNSEAYLDFGKEDAIFRLLLAGSAVPVPKIVARGTMSDLSWAISNRIAGIHLDALPPDEFVAMTPQVAAILDCIHRASISGTTGFGYFGAELTGQYATWREHVLSIREDRPGGYNPPWAVTFATTRLDEALIQEFFRRIGGLVDYCPEERCLVHGDYGFDNVLVQDGQITGVLDWLNAQFGDFLYDVAWLDFWSDIDFTAHFREHYTAIGRDIPHFAERIRCYQYVMACDCLRFNAYGGDSQAAVYDWLLPRVQRLLARQ
jgi:hygromycin-B 4-O-kinase